MALPPRPLDPRQHAIWLSRLKRLPLAPRPSLSASPYAVEAWLEQLRVKGAGARQRAEQRADQHYEKIANAETNLRGPLRSFAKQLHRIIAAHVPARPDPAHVAAQRV
jgi:hypothetical protein